MCLNTVAAVCLELIPQNHIGIQNQRVIYIQNKIYRGDESYVVKLQIELAKTSLQKFHIKMDCVVNEICV